jgi:hypothetical protein
VCDTAGVRLTLCKKVWPYAEAVGPETAVDLWACELCRSAAPLGDIQRDKGLIAQIRLTHVVLKRLDAIGTSMFQDWPQRLEDQQRMREEGR